MTFTVLIQSVTRAGDPQFFDLGVLIADSDHPEWKVEKILRVTLDPTLTSAALQTSLRNQIIADAAKYQKQAQIMAALDSLVGQTVTLP